MNIRYRVELTQSERDELTALLSGGLILTARFLPLRCRCQTGWLARRIGEWPSDRAPRAADPPHPGGPAVEPDSSGQRTAAGSEMIPFFKKLEPCTIYTEACGAGHYWARVLIGLGHDVKLIAPEAVKPFVKKGKKNDPADAAALCEIGGRPNINFVPVKTVE